MPKTILNEAEIQEACAALSNVSGPCASAEAKRLAAHFGCHVSRIYAATKHLRPKRKVRTDKGRRRVDLKEHAGMSFATAHRVASNLDPSLALQKARANYRELGFAKPEDATPVTVGTYRRWLREDGLNGRQLNSRTVVHRRWEAAAPGEIFQFDLSGLKTRWLDTKSRRVLHVSELEVSRNHPNKNSRRVKVWAFVVKDDHSRFLFFRFKAVDKPNSGDVIDFELECFREMGVPLELYSDNDAVIVSQLNRRAASILNRAFVDSGGFKLEQHMPGNPNASGKVESAHQFVERLEKLIGTLLTSPTIDELNEFAKKVCDFYNWTEHRTTGIKPAIRFRNGRGVMRMPPDEILNDAFKAREFDVKVNSDVTISVDGKKWQLPRSARIAGTLKGTKEIDNPFINLAILKKQVKVIWPMSAEWFVAIAGGNEFELAKVEAVADAAGEYKSVAESAAEHNRKHFKAKAVEIKEAAIAAIERGEPAPIHTPGFDVPFEIAAEARPAIMPRKRIDPSLADWATAASGAVPASAITEQTFTYWKAVDLLQAQGEFANPVTEREHDWLRLVFAGRDAIAETEIREKLPVVIDVGQVVQMRSA